MLFQIQTVHFLYAPIIFPWFLSLRRKTHLVPTPITRATPSMATPTNLSNRVPPPPPRNILRRWRRRKVLRVITSQRVRSCTWFWGVLSAWWCFYYLCSCSCVGINNGSSEGWWVSWSHNFCRNWHIYIDCQAQLVDWQTRDQEFVGFMGESMVPVGGDRGSGHPPGKTTCSYMFLRNTGTDPPWEAIGPLGSNYFLREVHTALFEIFWWQKFFRTPPPPPDFLDRPKGLNPPSSAVLCHWARHFISIAGSAHDWNIVDWNIKN